MIDKLETVRQVLANAIEQGLPGAQTAMEAWTDVNAAMMELNELHDELQDAQVDLGVAHG